MRSWTILRRGPSRMRRQLWINSREPWRLDSPILDGRGPSARRRPSDGRSSLLHWFIRSRRVAPFVDEPTPLRRVRTGPMDLINLQGSATARDGERREVKGDPLPLQHEGNGPRVDEPARRAELTWF